MCLMLRDYLHAKGWMLGILHNVAIEAYAAAASNSLPENLTPHCYHSGSDIFFYMDHIGVLSSDTQLHHQSSQSMAHLIISLERCIGLS